MPKFRIEVTTEDIRRGTRDSPCHCPVALAIARIIGVNPYLGEIDVDPHGVHLAGHRGLRRASPELPSVASRFIYDFDEGNPVEPFAFDLAIRTKPRARRTAP